MVPMADMLNAAYERDNARLFGDDDDDAGEEEGEVLDKLGEGYTMISTKEIKEGEQIVRTCSYPSVYWSSYQFNTYASPPNSELLRKYGHVDTYPLPEDVLALLKEDEIADYALGNPGDEVVLEMDHIVDAIHKVTGKSETKLQERAEWWLEEGQDE
jgi:SET domain-containing protein 6